MDKSCFIKIRKPWMPSLKKMSFQTLWFLIQLKIKSTTSLNTTTSKQPLSRNTVQNFWKNCHNLSKIKTSNSSLSWLLINFTINMPWRLMTVNTILKVWKTASSLTPFILQTVMRRLQSILPMKSSTNATNRLLLPSWMLDVLVVENWYHVSWFRSQMIWTLSDVPSTLLFNFHVSVEVWEFPSATFVKLVHLSKAMKVQLLESYLLWNSSKTASLTQTNWVNVKVLVLSTSTSSTQILSPSFQLRKKTPMKKFVLRLYHLVLWCLINSTNWRAKMKKCTSSAHIL